ncbi:MAG: hypothetical protein QXM31_00765 [Candidatus Woesearchaeota archaeon]
MKFAVAGVSGAGKTTLLRLLEQIAPNVTLHIKDTTRSPRTGEAAENSRDLSFLSPEQFEANRLSGAYDIVYSRYGHLYGMRRDQLLRAMQEKELHFAIISDIPSIKQFKYMYRDARAIYIHTDPRDIPDHMQQREGIEKSERLARITRAYHEFIDNNDVFDHVVLNFWEKENALRQLRNILHSYARTGAAGL